MRRPALRFHIVDGVTEPIFQWDGQWICLDCFKDSIKAMLEDDPVLLAYEMQVEVVRYI